ncbi:hypothetical protein [Vibrio phage RYC]|nr:hypothetical protein [Vibrio phage RYC]
MLVEIFPSCAGRGGFGQSVGGVTLSYTPCGECNQEGVVFISPNLKKT